MSHQEEFSPAYAVPVALDQLVHRDLLRDTSWHNDACPSFVVAQDHLVRDEEYLAVLWVEHPDPAQRESGAPRRFFVTNGPNPPIVETDNLVEALHALARQCEACGRDHGEAAFGEEVVCACGVTFRVVDLRPAEELLISLPDLVAAVKAEIRRDISDGTVPSSVRSFEELHDYVDANMYGAEELFGAVIPGRRFTREQLVAVLAAAHERVGQWLAKGRRGR